MAIEAELNNGCIKEEEANNKMCELQKEVDFFGSMEEYSRLIFKINKFSTFGLISVVIMFLVINRLKIFTIDTDYIMTTIICGIISQLLLIFTSLYAGMIIKKTQ